MAEKPILFSSKMVLAILEGRKTQTRRVMKTQPQAIPGGWSYDGKHFVSDDDMQSHLFHEVYGAKGSPYGAVYGDGTADSLWVRETWQGMSMQTAKWWHEVPRQDRPLHNWQWTNPVEPALQSNPPRWIPGIHMPRMVCRINLEIVNVRIDRLNNISEKDAINEGVEPPGAIIHFRELWESINASRGYGWSENPWVWIVEFRRL